MKINEKKCKKTSQIEIKMQFEEKKDMTLSQTLTFKGKAKTLGMCVPLLYKRNEMPTIEF